ncbi:MAG: hypothetical protein IPJ79_18710 [Bacteroidetes bacterium]|nr:hypothetical protein [Bacteroidota bacterium]
MFFDAKYPISVYAEAARWNQCVVFNERELVNAKNRLGGVKGKINRAKIASLACD